MDSFGCETLGKTGVFFIYYYLFILTFPRIPWKVLAMRTLNRDYCNLFRSTNGTARQKKDNGARMLQDPRDPAAVLARLGPPVNTVTRGDSIHFRELKSRREIPAHLTRTV